MSLKSLSFPFESFSRLNLRWLQLSLRPTSLAVVYHINTKSSKTMSTNQESRINKTTYLHRFCSQILQTLDNDFYHHLLLITNKDYRSGHIKGIPRVTNNGGPGARRLWGVLHIRNLQPVPWLRKHLHLGHGHRLLASPPRKPSFFQIILPFFTQR